MTRKEFLTQLGEKTARNLIKSFLAEGSVNCFQIMDQLPVTKMSMVEGETLEAFRERWYDLVDRALGCRATDASDDFCVFKTAPEDNEAAALLRDTFGEDVLEALRWAR